MNKPKPLKGKIKIHEPEAEVLNLFLEAWKEKTGKDYVDSFPFANQDNWTGTAVMNFAKFIVEKKNKDVKSAVQGLLEEIRSEIKDTKFAMKSEFDEGVIEGLKLAEFRIKKWFADVVNEE